MVGSRRKYFFLPPLWWQFMQSRHDFLLRIAPNCHYRHKEDDQSCYPPPGYGPPPGLIHSDKQFRPAHKYALFLFPGKLTRFFFWFSLLLPLIIFIPVMGTKFRILFTDIEPPWTYAIAIFMFWLVSYLFYLFLYRYLMPPVLSRVWEKWPVPANHLFLSVPHDVAVNENCKKEDENIYWQPDRRNDMHRQTSQFAPDTQSLQEILLNFAVFDFFFKRPDTYHLKHTQNEEGSADTNENLVEELIQKLEDRQPVSYEKVIREKEWYWYLFTPIWLNYGLIVLSLLILVSLPVETSTCVSPWIPVTHLPYNFIPVIILWLFLSLLYMSNIIQSLESIHNKIRKGAFNAHLELVPQPILQELSNIPEPQHIDAGIQHIKRTMSLVSGIGLIAFLGIVEILSQAYGDTPTSIVLGG